MGRSFCWNLSLAKKFRATTHNHKSRMYWMQKVVDKNISEPPHTDLHCKYSIIVKAFGPQTQVYNIDTIFSNILMIWQMYLHVKQQQNMHLMYNKTLVFWLPCKVVYLMSSTNWMLKEMWESISCIKGLVSLSFIKLLKSSVTNLINTVESQSEEHGNQFHAITNSFIFPLSRNTFKAVSSYFLFIYWHMH